MATYKKDGPRFDGTNYSLWKVRMQCQLRCIGEAFQKITKDPYVIPQNGPSTIDEIKDAENNIRVIEALVSALTDSEMENVIGLQIAHEIWMKLETLYEGNAQVKLAK